MKNAKSKKIPINSINQPQAKLINEKVVKRMMIVKVVVVDVFQGQKKKEDVPIASMTLMF